ncbi:hypothetical protein C477_04044 [Haloterrigena salina JCM 13891]|uniref:SMODS and SLOG-associating 2TM effector domain-containing protein n=1 Tax=Haloterrigena salina JCM 13891 TaxID=1227488 RepID=M0CJL4_9EURY|nr:SLATT domain-containing protein [Haloterrigena salina]ELZ22537.1 hypothetical protein C477_04044 [Haloterrigena salina JCM 13891]
MSDHEPASVRDRIERSALIKADSLNHTYNQHFLAANFYRWLNRFLDTVLFAASLLLVSQALWTVWPAWTTFAIPGVMAIITGYRRAAKPDQRSERFRKSANRHHALFDELRDFLMVRLPDGSCSDDEVQDRFDELAERRRELNMDSPDASSLWYYWIKYVRGEEKLLEQISTTKEMREAITGKAFEAAKD